MGQYPAWQEAGWSPRQRLVSDACGLPKKSKNKRAERGAVSRCACGAVREHFALWVTETKAAEKAIKGG